MYTLSLQATTVGGYFKSRKFFPIQKMEKSIYNLFILQHIRGAYF